MIKYFVEYYLLDDPNAPKFKEVENQSIESANLPNDTCAYRFYNQNYYVVKDIHWKRLKKVLMNLVVYFQKWKKIIGIELCV